MRPEQSKTVLQVLLLVVLLGGLGFGVYRISTNPAVKRNTVKEQVDEADRITGTEDRPSSLNMPPVPTTSGATSKKADDLVASREDLNDDIFRVYALNPPRNPFVQKQAWYEDDLQQLPGYPELVDSEYFESRDAYLPPVPMIFDESHKWKSIQVQRSAGDESYQIAGTSEDGNIRTTVTMVEEPARDDSFIWSPATGVPLEDLSAPGWRDKYGNQLDTMLDLSSEEEEQGPVTPLPGLAGGADLFGGLPLPGGGLGADDGGISNLQNGQSGGSSLSCVGVNLQAGREAQALVRFNDSSYLVSAGSTVGSRFQVVAVKENGVVLSDVEAGRTIWLPLGQPAELVQ